MANKFYLEIWFIPNRTARSRTFSYVASCSRGQAKGMLPAQMKHALFGTLYISFSQPHATFMGQLKKRKQAQDACVPVRLERTIEHPPIAGAIRLPTIRDLGTHLIKVMTIMRPPLI